MGRWPGPGKNQCQLLAATELRNQGRPRTRESCEIAGSGAARRPFERRRFRKPAIEDRWGWARRAAPQSGGKRVSESETSRAQRLGFAGQHRRRRRPLGDFPMARGRMRLSHPQSRLGLAMAATECPPRANFRARYADFWLARGLECLHGAPGTGRSKTKKGFRKKACPENLRAAR